MSMILLLAVLASANALSCTSCETEKGCLNPFDCASNSTCFTLTSKASGKVIKRGCASCNDVRQRTDGICEDCDERDFCNDGKQAIGKDVNVTHHEHSNGTLKQIGTETVKDGSLGHGFLTTTAAPSQKPSAAPESSPILETSNYIAFGFGLVCLVSYLFLCCCVPYLVAGRHTRDRLPVSP